MRFKAASPWGYTSAHASPANLLAPARPLPALLERPWVSPLGRALRRGRLCIVRYRFHPLLPGASIVRPPGPPSVSQEENPPEKAG